MVEHVTPQYPQTKLRRQSIPALCGPSCRRLAVAMTRYWTTGRLAIYARLDETRSTSPRPDRCLCTLSFSYPHPEMD